MNFTSKPGWVVVVGLLAASAVALGAVAAHALPEPAATSVERASTYQLFHAIALLVLAGATGVWIGWVRALMLGGVICFSGAIYAKHLLGFPSLGSLAPLGGVLLILSWLVLVVGAQRRRQPNP